MTQNNSTKYIDRLKEDEPIQNQNWVCLSFLSPEGVRNCSVRGLKIRGVFNTREEADNRAKELQHLDPYFHVFVGEVGKWLPWDPDVNDTNQVKDQYYYEKELQKLMEGYKENMERSKKMHQQYKTDMLKQGQQQELSKEEKTKARLRRKLEEKKQQQKIDSIVNRQLITEDSDQPVSNNNIKYTEQEEKLLDKGDEIKMTEDSVKTERTNLNNLEKEIQNQTQKVDTIDSKLAKIQALYNKLNKNN